MGGGRTIKDFVQAFRDMGYFCHYEVLNTKDYGVPQNRERIFLVGFKCDEHYHNFNFAPKITLEKRLRDVLENDIDEKYYLSQKLINNFIHGKSEFNFEPHNKEDEYSKYLTARYFKMGRTDPYIKEPKLRVVGMLDIKGDESIRRVHDSDGLSPTLTTMEGGNRQPKICENIKPSVRENFKRDYEEIVRSDKNIFYSECTSGFQDNKVCLKESACLRANNDNLFTLDNEYRIRKLTPRECFRLQDFPDSFKFVVSNSQLYKQVGNSISVNVIEMIFKQIEASRYGSTDALSLF